MSTPPDDLPRDIRALLRRNQDVLVTSGAKQAGISESRLRRLTAAGELRRLAHGAYVDAKAFAKLDKWERFKLEARAFALMAGEGSFLTGWACVAIREFPTLGPPPKLATIIRPKGHRRKQFTGTHGRVLVADLPQDHQWQLGRLFVTSDEWAVVDLARTARLPDSLVVADEATRRGLDLAGVLPHMQRWQGINRAAWVVERAEPTVESPLETLGRFTFIEYDLPMPVTNAWVGRDRPEWRLDGLFPWHWWAYEADGAVKYDNRDDAAQIVRAQQEREFQLRRLGLDLLRYGWADAYPNRKPLVAKARAMFCDHPPRPKPVRWWKDVPGKGPVEPSREDWPLADSRGLVLPAGWQHESDGSRADGDASST